LLLTPRGGLVPVTEASNMSSMLKNFFFEGLVFEHLLRSEADEEEANISIKLELDCGLMGIEIIWEVGRMEEMCSELFVFSNSLIVASFY
jgi:hypothetical protein